VKRHLSAGRLVRLAPAALAAYELHSLLGSVAHAGAAVHWLQQLSLGSAAPWILLALAVGAGALLREMGRGLLALLAVGALLGGTLDGHAHALLSGFGSVGWTSVIPLAVLAGLVITDAFDGVRWAVRALARLHGHPPHRLHPRRRALPVRRLTVIWQPAPAPLLAGWSGRGPPTVTV
jgi:hypothetical protein